jgi:hypothetical protein
MAHNFKQGWDRGNNSGMHRLANCAVSSYFDCQYQYLIRDR